MTEINLSSIKKTAMEEERIAGLLQKLAAETQNVLSEMKSGRRTYTIAAPPVDKMHTELVLLGRQMKQYSEAVSAICRVYENAERRMNSCKTVRKYGEHSYQNIDLEAYADILGSLGRIRM